MTATKESRYDPRQIIELPEPDLLTISKDGSAGFRPEARDAARAELMRRGVSPSEWGGEVPPASAGVTAWPAEKSLGSKVFATLLLVFGSGGLLTIVYTAIAVAFGYSQGLLPRPGYFFVVVAIVLGGVSALLLWSGVRMSDRWRKALGIWLFIYGGLGALSSVLGQSSPSSMETDAITLPFMLIVLALGFWLIGRDGSSHDMDSATESFD